MRLNKRTFFLTAITVSLCLLTGCENGAETLQPSSTASSEPAIVDSSVTANVEAAEIAVIGDNGYWKGIRALDYAEAFEYDGLVIPKDKHTIPEEAVQSAIDGLLAAYSTEEKILDRSVQDGDTINIDFVGSVDGVEFERGSTEGQGTDVTIGETQFIDDFLDQLVGHMPGETIHVEVTFPEDYGVDHLNGQDAVFVTTINHIAGYSTPELTDAFVKENMAAEYGWSSVDEMREGMLADLRQTAVDDYIENYLITEVAVSKVPDGIVAYVENMMVEYFEDSAAYSEMETGDFLTEQEGVSSVDDLLVKYRDDNLSMATYSLVVQSVAEALGLEVSDGEVADYFENVIGVSDYSQYEAQFGMPYLKQAALQRTVLKYLSNHAVLA